MKWSKNYISSFAKSEEEMHGVEYWMWKQLKARYAFDTDNQILL